MTIRTHQIEGGAKVLIFECDVCGAPASFGTGCNIREALRTGDVKRAGVWTCGPDGCRAAIVQSAQIVQNAQLEQT